ncbi:MAG: hypothetical protein ACLS9K_03715 [Lachnospira eligens]
MLLNSNLDETYESLEKVSATNTDDTNNCYYSNKSDPEQAQKVANAVRILQHSILRGGY